MDVPPAVRRKFARHITVGGLKVKVELLPAAWLGAPFTGIMVSAGRGHSVSSRSTAHTRGPRRPITTA